MALLSRGEFSRDTLTTVAALLPSCGEIYAEHFGRFVDWCRLHGIVSCGLLQVRVLVLDFSAAFLSKSRHV